MNKLAIGMYVRTKDGIITKVDYIDDETIYFDKDIYRIYSAGIDFLEKDNLERIKKVSFDIIDLIEAGDYVNGSKVIEIEKDYEFIDGTIRDILWTDTRIQTAIWDETIKSIITKEQFESMSYRIGE